MARKIFLAALAIIIFGAGCQPINQTKTATPRGLYTIEKLPYVEIWLDDQLLVSSKKRIIDYELSPDKKMLLYLEEDGDLYLKKDKIERVAQGVEKFKWNEDSRSFIYRKNNQEYRRELNIKGELGEEISL